MPQFNLTNSLPEKGGIKPASYEPACRLVSLFTASGASEDICDFALKLGRKAASLGETVLILDAIDGDLMNQAGIIYARTLTDVIEKTDALQDALYVTSNEHFTAAAIGEGGLETAMGLITAMSLSYDWIFVVPHAGCETGHVKLGQASDLSVISYDTDADQFMRAYWMVDAMRRRSPNFDPFVLSTGQKSGALETALMLSETIREYLGAPPHYGGHSEDLHIEARLLEQMRQHMLARATA